MANEIQWTLGECFAQEALSGVVNWQLFSRYKVSEWHVIVARAWVFQKGAIFGETKSHRKRPLAQLLGIPKGKEDEVWGILKRNADESLSVYGKEPNTFLDYIHKTMFPNTDFDNIRTLKRLHDKKYHLQEVLSLFQEDVTSGIGFGVSHPKLVQKMWIQSYETDRDTRLWAEARRQGLDIPEKQNRLPLAVMEAEVLQEVRDFVKEYKPHLIKPLDL